MSSDRNIFAEEGETVDKVIFRPLSLDLNQKVKKVSDPPPRPLPPRLDNRPDEGWTRKSAPLMEQKWLSRCKGWEAFSNTSSS